MPMGLSPLLSDMVRSVVMAQVSRYALGNRTHVGWTGQPLDKQPALVVGEHRMSHRIQELEEYARRGTGLERIPGSFGPPGRWLED
jgi:hypothetical protein